MPQLEIMTFHEASQIVPTTEPLTSPYMSTVDTTSPPTIPMTTVIAGKTTDTFITTTLPMTTTTDILQTTAVTCAHSFTFTEAGCFYVENINPKLGTKRRTCVNLLEQMFI